MKNSNFHMLLFVSLSLFSFMGCSKNDDNAAPAEQLPPATQIGANTAGAYINGELLVPKNSLADFGAPASPGLKFVVGPHFFDPEGDDYFAVTIANRRDNGGDYLYLQLPTLSAGEGEYILGQSNGQKGPDGSNNPYITVVTRNEADEGKTYYSGAVAGIVTITKINIENGIFAGEFAATLYNRDNPSETIHVTEGRFDIDGSTLNQ